MISLIKTHKLKVDRITCTGGGVQPAEDIVADEDSLNEFLLCYIGPDGRDENTFNNYKNIWGMYSFTSLSACVC